MAFYDNEDYKAEVIHIPEGCTSIKATDFKNFKNLKKLYLPVSLKYIGYRTFARCSSLEEIIIDENNKNFIIKDNIIYDKLGTTLLMAVANAIKETVIIPEGVKVISKEAFYMCSKLKFIYFPKSLEFIKGQAFDFCKNLQMVYFKNSNAKLFAGSISLEVVKNSIYNIFPLQASKFNNIEVIYIGLERAIYSTDYDSDFCKNWARYFKLRICTFYTIIESDEFFDHVKKYRKEISDFNMTDSEFRDELNKHIDDFIKVLNEVSVDETISKSINIIDVINIKLPMESYKWTRTHCLVITSDKVKHLPKNFITNCNFIYSISIPDTVTSIDYNFITACKNLDEIILSPTNSNFLYQDNILYNKVSKDILYVSPSIEGIVKFVDGVKCIPKNLLEGNSNITEIEIPESVTFIGARAFKTCNNLSVIKIHASKVILNDSAADLNVIKKSLRYIDCPNIISARLFYSCFLEILDLINDSSIDEDIRDKWLYSISDKISKKYDIILDYKKVLDMLMDKTYLSTYDAKKILNSFEERGEIIDKGFIEKLREYISSNIKIEVIEEEQDFSLTRKYLMNVLEIPKGTKVIKSLEYKGYPWVETLIIPEGVERIEEQAFWDCKSLKTVYIPSTLTYFDQKAFDSCKKLQDVIVSEKNSHFFSENGVLFNKDKTEIIVVFDKRFSGKFEIPSSVTEINKNIFKDCNFIEEVDFPFSVEKIEDGVLLDCVNLNLFRIYNDKIKITKNFANFLSILNSVNYLGPERVMNDFRDIVATALIELFDSKKVNPNKFCNGKWADYIFKRFGIKY